MSKKKKILVGILSALAAALATAGIVVGVVFSIKNYGPFEGTVTDIETGEPLAGVSVSDGRNVVKTDENGNFKLKGYVRSRFVIVTTPAGYTTEEYYIAVEKNKESYDFKLQKSEATAKTEHGFVQVSDTEIGDGGVGEWINHVKKTAEETDAAFLIHTGDICYEAGLKRHKKDMNTENMGLPVRYVIGNHDYVDGKYGEELFESIYGPVWYSFEVGKVHYIVTPIQFGDVVSGYMPNDRWKWLKNDIENTDPDMKIVIFNHNNPPSDDYVIKYPGGKIDLKEHNLAAWVFGHYHYNYIEENNGVLNISTGRPDSGGIDSAASGTRYISFDKDGKITTKMYYYNMPETAPAPENAVWSAQLDSRVLFTDTLDANGKIYTATSEEDYPNKNAVYCLDEKTGEIIWKAPVNNAVRNNLIYADGKIVAQDADGRVLCLNAETGEKIWDAKAEIKFSLGTNSGICTDGKTVYAGNSADVTALNLADGKTAWTYNRGHGENSPAEFVLVGDKLILSPNWDALVAIDKNTGKMLWENKDEDIRFRSSTPVIVDEKTLLVADSNAIMLVNIETGEITSKTEPEGYNFSSSGQPVIADGKAYIPTATNGLVAFDIASKKIVWEVKTAGAIVGTPPYVGPGADIIESTPVLKDGCLFFGASDGYVYKVDTNDGKIIAKANIGAPILGKAVLCDDGTVIVADFAGRVSRVTLGD